MPKGVYNRKPAEGAAVGGGESPVRGPIKDMLASGSDEEFKNSLPDQTSSETQDSPEESRPRKKYTKRKSAKEDSTPIDARLERANAKMSGLGLAQLTESGFALSGHPLEDQEKEDVEDQFYAIAKKANVDPSGSWVFVVVYTVILLARLALSRTELGGQVKSLIEDLFKSKGGDSETQETETQSGTV